MYRTLTLITFLLLSLNTFSQDAAKQKLDSVFSMMLAQNQFNGTALVAEGGKIILSKGYGYQDTQMMKKNSSKTLYDLASCSKQFTAAAVVLLYRKGRLSYEDSLSKFIPELAHWGRVTIYDLLRHTSGIPEYLIDMSKGLNHSKIATNDDLVSFYATRKDTLMFAPGSRHRYCNTNYAFLATIVSRVSGMSLAEFLKKNIFSPLKMNHTFIYNSRQHPQNIRNRATGYVWKKNSFNRITSENPDYGDSLVYYLDGIVGNAKVNSTVTDIFKWFNVLKNNSFFTSEEFSLMTRQVKTSNGKSVPYGFGLDLSSSGNNLSFGHTGSWDGYSTFTYHNMGKDRTIITLQNFKMGAYPFNTINQILDKKPIDVEYVQRVLLPWPDVSKFVGIYIDKDHNHEKQEISFLEGYLIYNTQTVKWDMRFFPINNNRFKAIRQGGSDGELRFTEMTNGEIKLEMLQSGKIIGTSFKKTGH